MEPTSLIPVTLASILASFSGNNGVVEEAVISTHVRPEIAGLWELELQSTPDFVQKARTASTSEKGEMSPELSELINAIEESEKLSQLKSVERDNMYLGNAQDNDKNSTQDKPVLTLNATAPNSSCRERYNFGADNEVLTTSGEEWTFGKYIYQHQAEGLPVIAINTIYDNNKMDCSGVQVDQTGDSILAFVDYQPKENKMRWCVDKDGENCFMTFTKLLP